MDYVYEFADENTFNFLIDNNIIIKNNDVVEIESTYLEFFEEILSVNEEINTSRINEYIKAISDNIGYYFEENNETRRYFYVGQVRKTINTVSKAVMRNVIDLKRNIDSAYKNEPNFKVKRLKLKKLHEKYEAVSSLIKQCEELTEENKRTFFAVASDELLNAAVSFMKISFNEAYHSLLNINNQIIDYIQKIDYQLNKLKKIRKLKYLRDQFTIEKSTDIYSVINGINPVWMENTVKFKTLVSIEMLRNTDVGLEIIKNVSQKIKNKTRILRKTAEPISEDFFNENTQTEEVFDYIEIKNAFSAQSRDLYSFIGNYNFKKTLQTDEKLLLFCQLATQFGSGFNITEEFQNDGIYSYSLIYPK
ncbi:MAG: hypothetical protein II937_06505 [Bacteroidales bacterium]|nr:hypothetical protein [Bacteroidales bacterium]